MFKIVFKLLILLLPYCLQATINFEEGYDSFVLETKQIKIPGYPDAFNPSIVRWNGKLLLSFRNIKNAKNPYHSSQIGLVYVDENFNPSGDIQILHLGQQENPHYERAEDARLVIIDGHLFMVYSDNEDPIISKGGFRVYVAELEEKNGLFTLISKDRLTQYQGASPNLREKNWTPFEYHGTLLLSYSLNPHLVFRPLLGTEQCETFANSEKSLSWDWGELRGGTQTLWVEDRYLTFFHTSLRMATEHSQGREMLHYFMGACTFDGEAPFEMKEISPQPIFGRDFFTGPYYPPYFGSWRGIFPGGFIFDDDFIWIVFGRQNHELWVAKLSKRDLLESLIPISS